MKKLIIIAALLIISCTKESITPQTDCNCGRIVSDNVYDYSVVIRNKCSGNDMKFYMTQSDWMRAYVGIDWCITGYGKW